MARKSPLDPLLFTLFETKPSKGDQMRAEIIDTALKNMVATGIDSMGFESIAKRMGTRRSHVAYYFEDRDAIIENVYRYLYGKRNRATEAAKEETHDPEAALTRYLNSQFDWFGDETILLRGKVLFYYHAAINEKYRKLQFEVRVFGRKRIEALLKLFPKFEKSSAKALSELADAVQSVIIGQLIYAVTTEELSDATLQKAKESAHSSIRKLIS